MVDIPRLPNLLEVASPDWKECPFTYVALALLLLYTIQMIWGVIYLAKLFQVPRRKAQKSFLFFIVLESVTRMGFFGVWPTQISDNGQCTPNAMDSYSFIMDFLGTIPVCFFLTAFSLYIFTFARVHKLFQLQYLRWPPRRVLLFYRFLSITFVVINVTVYVSTLVQLPFRAARENDSPDNLSLLSWFSPTSTSSASSASPSFMGISLPDEDTIHDTSAALAIYSIVIGTLLLAIVFIIIATSLANTIDEYLYLEQLKQQDDLIFAGGDTTMPQLSSPSTVSSLPPAIPTNTAVRNTPSVSSSNVQLADAELPLLNDTDDDSIDASPSLHHIPSASASGRFGIHGLGGNFRRGAAPATERTRSKRDVLSFLTEWLSPRRDRDTSANNPNNSASNSDNTRLIRQPLRKINIYRYHADNIAAEGEDPTFAFLDAGRRPPLLAGSYTYTAQPPQPAYPSRTPALPASITIASSASTAATAAANNNTGSANIGSYAPPTSPRMTPPITPSGTSFNPLSTPSSFSVRLERGGGGGLVPRYTQMPSANVNASTRMAPQLARAGSNASGNSDRNAAIAGNTQQQQNTYSTTTTATVPVAVPLAARLAMPQETQLQQIYSYGVRGRPALNPHKNPMRKLVRVAWITGFCLAVRAALLPLFNVVLHGSIHWAWLLAYFLFAELMPVFTMLSVFEIAAAPTVQWNNAYGIDIALASDRALNYALHMYNLYQSRMIAQKQRKEREARGEYDVVEEGMYRPNNNSGNNSGSNSQGGLSRDLDDPFYNLEGGDSRVTIPTNEDPRMSDRYSGMNGDRAYGSVGSSGGAVYGSSVPIDDAMLILANVSAGNLNSGGNSSGTAANYTSASSLASVDMQQPPLLKAYSYQHPNGETDTDALANAEAFGYSYTSGYINDINSGASRNITINSGNPAKPTGNIAMTPNKSSRARPMAHSLRGNTTTAYSLYDASATQRTFAGESVDAAHGMGTLGKSYVEAMLFNDSGTVRANASMEVSSVGGSVGKDADVGNPENGYVNISEEVQESADISASSDPTIHGSNAGTQSPPQHVHNDDLLPLNTLPLRRQTSADNMTTDGVQAHPEKYNSGSSRKPHSSSVTATKSSRKSAGIPIADAPAVVNVKTETANTEKSPAQGITPTAASPDITLRVYDAYADNSPVKATEMSGKANVSNAAVIGNTDTLSVGELNTRFLGDNSVRNLKIFSGTETEESGQGLQSFASCLSETGVPQDALVGTMHSLNADTPQFTHTTSPDHIPMSMPMLPSSATKSSKSTTNTSTMNPVGSIENSIGSSGTSTSSHWVPNSPVEDMSSSSSSLAQPIAVPVAKKGNKMQTPARSKSGFSVSGVPMSVTKVNTVSVRSPDYMPEFGQVSFGHSESFRGPPAEDEYERFTREMQSTLTSDSLDKSLLGEDRHEYDY